MSQQSGGTGQPAPYGPPSPEPARAEQAVAVPDSRPATEGADNRLAPGGNDHQLAPGVPRLLVLVAAGIGLLIYLLGFFGELSVSNSFGGPMLVGGGLLAGTAVLPKAGRVLAPAAVLITLGTLLLLQLVVAIGGPSVVIIALVLAFLETGAVVGALLLDAGLVTTAPRRSRATPFGPPQQGYGGYPPGPGGWGGPPPGYGQPGGVGGRYGGPSEGVGHVPPGYGQHEEPGTPGYGFPAAPPSGYGPPPQSAPQSPGAQAPADPAARPWYFGPDRVNRAAEPAIGTGSAASAESTTLFSSPESPAAGSSAADSPATDSSSPRYSGPSLAEAGSPESPGTAPVDRPEPADDRRGQDPRTEPQEDSDRTQVFRTVDRPPSD